MGWFDSIVDTLGSGFNSIDASDIETGLDIAGSGLSVASGVSGLFDSSMSDAKDAQRKSLALQTELAKRSAAIGDEGGAALADAFKQYLDSVGSEGFYTPDKIDQLSNKFEAARRGEHVQEKAQVENLMEDLMGLGGQIGGDTPNYNEIANIAPGDYKRYADVSPGNYYDEMGRINANVSAREGNYDGLINELSQGYLDRFSNNTERAVDNIYANQEVDAIRRGMDRSTYDIQSKRAASAEAKKLYDEDVMKSIDEALAFIQGRQGLDTGNQGMRLNQLQGESSVAELGMNAVGQNVGDRFKRGGMMLNAEAQGQGDRYKSAGLRMSAGQNSIMDKIRSLEAGQNLMANSQNMRANQWNTPNIEYDSLGKAYSSFGREQDARRSGFQEMAYTIGKPYEFQKTGVSNAGSLNTGSIQGWSDAYNTSSANRTATNKNLGFGLHQASQVDWNNIFGDDD